MWNVIEAFSDSFVLYPVSFDLEHVNVEDSSDAFVLEANQSFAVAFRHSPGFASPEDCVDGGSNEDVPLGLEGDVFCRPTSILALMSLLYFII